MEVHLMPEQKIKISPSLLACDFSRLGEEIRAIVTAGADMIHCDIMDGHFVPNITFGPPVVAKLRSHCSVPLDVHLMIENPSQHLSAFANAGADYLGVHIENQPNIHRLVQNIHEMHCKSTIVINPGTPVSALQAILPETDMVLVMSVNPGFSGQKFIQGTIQKFAELRQLLINASSSALIQVDGGITAETLPPCYQAGARSFVSASYIFNNPQGIAAAVSALRSSNI